MVKSSFALDSDKENDEFGRKYIPEEFVWMTLNKGEGPFSPHINPNTYLIYISFFIEGRWAFFTIPPLLVEFLRLTHLHITQLAINSLHIIMGVV